MALPYDRNLKPFARSLRASMTDAERKLWSAVRRKQIEGHLFTRQKTIRRYIADFYCASASLVIELDGGQHYTMAGRRKDEVRDSTLANLGLRILRFSDRDVLTNTEAVLEVIRGACRKPTNPLAPPFRKGEGGTGGRGLPG